MKKSERKTISVRIPSDLWIKITQQADRLGISYNDVINFALREKLIERRKDGKKNPEIDFLTV